MGRTKYYLWSSIGRILILLGGAMLLPAVVGFFYGEAECRDFLWIACMAAVVGVLLSGEKRKHRGRKYAYLKENYKIVAYGWLIATFFAMLPYWKTGTVTTITDAWFEAMSGLTAVGASVLEYPEKLAHCVLLWRSMTQWLGGMGILVLFIALLSGQGTGAMQIFKTEAAGLGNNKLQPRLMGTARVLWIIYMIHTFAAIFFYRMAGMNWFDAVNHGMTSVATGGFSTRRGSIGSYDSPWLDLVATGVMFFSGVSYSLYFYAFRTKRLRCFWNSLEMRVYVLLIGLATLGIAFFIAPEYGYHWGIIFRHAAFQATSMITTTGYVTADYSHWAIPAQVLLIALMLCGACAGSTSSGIKIDRHILLAKKAMQEIRRFLHPNLVTRVKSNHRLVEDEMILSVAIFFYVYISLILVGTYGLCLFGGNVFDSLTTIMSCLGGIGPSIGVWGPLESYEGVSVAGKWMLSGWMLLGRLEIYTVLLLLPSFHTKRRQKNVIVTEDMEESGVVEPWVRDRE